MNRFLSLTATLLLVPVRSSPANTCVEMPLPNPIRHLCGVVVDPVGTRLPRATVHLLQGDKTVLTAQTDEHGFSADKLPAGHYEIIVKLEGFRVFGSSFSITDPGPDCKIELLVTLDVGEGCSVLSVVNPKNYK